MLNIYLKYISFTAKNESDVTAKPEPKLADSKPDDKTKNDKSKATDKSKDGDKARAPEKVEVIDERSRDSTSGELKTVFNYHDDSLFKITFLRHFVLTYTGFSWFLDWVPSSH